VTRYLTIRARSCGPLAVHDIIAGARSQQPCFFTLQHPPIARPSARQGYVKRASAITWFVSRWAPRGPCSGPRRPLSNASEFDRERRLPPQARRGCELRRRGHAGRVGLEQRSRFLDAVGAKLPRKKHPTAKNNQYSQYSQRSQWSICPSQPFMRKSSPMDAQRSAGSRAGATPRAAKRRLFWSAPAERNADLLLPQICAWLSPRGPARASRRVAVAAQTQPKIGPPPPLPSDGRGAGVRVRRTPP